MEYADLVKAFGAFFAIMNPFVNLPIFLALTVGFTLEGNIRCNFGDFLAMAQSCKIGEVITVDGFLEDLSENQTVIEPALGRDPLAPFRPLK